MSRVSRGVMEVTLNEHEYTLKVTVHAVEALENRFGGGLINAANACVKLPFQDAAFIIQKAAGLPKSELGKIKEDIVMEGIEAASGICADYLQMVLNPDGAEPTEGDESGEG